MTPRALRSWVGFFSLVVALSGGCGRREETPTQRAPNVVDSSAELFAVDDAGTKNEGVTHELVGDWTPPAVIETARPPLPRARVAKKVDAPAKAEVVQVEPPVPSQPPPPIASTERRVPPPAPAQAAKAERNWQTVPAPDVRGPYRTAIDVSVAVGAIAVGMGTTATASGDGAPGSTAFAIGALGVGVVSFSTALVLYLIEPAPPAKPNANANASARGVSLTPGLLGVRGTF
jgi:hypothetical protein